MRQSIFAVTLCVGIAGAALSAQTPATGPPKPGHAGHGVTPAQNTPDEKIKLALSAAPADVAQNATVVEPGEDGQMKTLRPGTNGWVCMPAPEVMCLDKAWQGWADAWMNKKPVKVDRVGVAYMLQGDYGVSNTDPYATEPTSTNQWVQTGAHIMLLVPDNAALDALPTDPYGGGPYVMWKGTPYAHVMIPVETMPKQQHGKGTKK